jgi:glutamyl-tRNA reductase
MPIILVGLNHNTAPVELRERLSLAGCGLTFALAELPVHPAVFNGDPIYGDLPHIPPALSEGAILSTCNRLEVYAVTREMAVGRAAAKNFLSRLQGIPPAMLKPHLYFMHDQEAVFHLMRVAAGLDSLILGEPQILGQVAQAFASARTASATGPVLSQLFAQAIRAGKRARTETGISRHTTSVSHAAALLAEEQLGGLENAHGLVIGAGEMAELAAQALRLRGAPHIACINRTYSSAQALAEKIGGQAIAWHDLTAALTRADVVISATGAPHTVIHEDDVTPALPARAGRPLIFVDMAVPRDIEEEVGSLPGVTRYDIDDLQVVLDENMAQREATIPRVDAIIAEEAAAFASWMNSLEIVPVIADLRAYAARIAQVEVERALDALKNAGPDEQKAVELLAHRLVNNLLHIPTVRLREQAAHGNGYTYAHVVRELFDLSESQYQSNRARKNANGHRQAVMEREGAISGD